MFVFATVLGVVLVAGLVACGSNLRVYGGRYAEEDSVSFPWYGYITNQTVGYHPMCGASLITPQHVLTLAKCVENHQQKYLLARFGYSNWCKETSMPGMSTEWASIVDARYEELDVDPLARLAVAKLDHSISAIEQISLPFDVSHYDSSRWQYVYLLPGFGEYNPHTGWLDCNFKYEILHPHQNAQCCQVNSHFICASPNAMGNGDEGGPLVQQICSEQSCQLYIHGVAAYRHRCHECEDVDLYRDVYMVKDWIEKNVFF